MQLVNHNKYSHIPSISQSEAFLKTTLEFWKDIIKAIWPLTTYELFKYFGDNKNNTDWKKVIGERWLLIEERCYIWKYDSCMNLWKTYGLLELKTYLFRKKIYIFFQNFDRNIVLLALNLFDFLEHSIFINTYKIKTWKALQEMRNYIDACLISIYNYNL